MPTRLTETAILALHVLRTRKLRGMRFGTRASLLDWQRQRIAALLRDLPRVPYYRGCTGMRLAQLPLMDQPTLLANFPTLNVAGIDLEAARATALAAEATRAVGARPSTQFGDIAIGLSSGTTGVRSVFLRARSEQLRAADVLLARMLDGQLLRQLLLRRQALQVACFTGSEGHCYSPVASRRLEVRSYDLLGGVAPHLTSLQAQQPDILMAPARILGELAALVLAGSLRLTPRKAIAVGEALEPDDRQRIERAFGGPVHQLYHGAGSLLGATCRHGTLHLNEECVHVEAEWLDAACTRFIPILTDFTRSTQPLVRYRLSDILRVRAQACPCGSAALALEAVEGRWSDILWMVSKVGIGQVALYPDLVRDAIALSARALPDYRIEQHGAVLRIGVADADRTSFDAIVQAVHLAALRQGGEAPACSMVPFRATAPQHKRRRIVCVEGLRA